MTTGRAKLTVSLAFAAMQATLGVSIARDAHADEKQEVAAESFKRGAEAYARKDYRAAALAFEAANQVSPAGAVLYNAALAWQAAGEELRAATAFDAALTTGSLRPAEATDARRKLEGLDARLGRLEVIAPEGVRASVDKADPVATPAHVRVAPGEHTVRATLPDGTTPSEHVTLVGGATSRVDFNKPPPSPPALPAIPQAAQHVGASDGSVRRTLGWVGVGAGVALSGSAIALGVVGIGALHDFQNGSDQSPSLHDKAVSFRTYADVAWAGAAVLGGTGLALVIMSYGRRGAGQPDLRVREEREATLSVGPTGAFVTGRF